MINQPEKRKDHRGLIIEKLDIPLPVYNVIKDIKEDSINIKYEKLIY